MEKIVYIIFVFLYTLGGALSKKAFLTLTEEPGDTVFNTNSNRESAMFHCKADGYPKPDITWVANGQIITENNLYNVTEEGSLRIPNPPRHLNGSSYQCIANSSFGAAMSKVATLEVAYVDMFPSNSQEGSTTVNAKLGKCISCNPPSAYPGIQARWKKGTGSGSDVDSNDRIREMVDGRLCFAYTIRGDRGTYFCLVSNRYDDGAATGYLRSPSHSLFVNSGGTREQDLDPVPGQQEHVTVKQGHEAVLECFFFGKPTPTLVWDRRDADLPINSTQPRNNQELRIPNAQPQDSGEYICTGTTSGVPSQTVYRYLTVLAPPNLVSGLKNEEVDPESTITLQCTTDSDGVEFSWYHNTRLIDSNMPRTQITEDNTLIIDNIMVKDSGIYQCAARNQHGVSLSTAQISVKEQEPIKENPTKSETSLSENDPPGNGAGDTLVHGFSLVVMLSAVLLEVILIFV